MNIKLPNMKRFMYYVFVSYANQVSIFIDTYLQMMSSAVEKFQHNVIAVYSCVDRITSFQFGIVVANEAARQKADYERWISNHPAVPLP